MKYIITEDSNGLENIYLFPPWVEHFIFAEKINQKIVSAGKITFILNKLGACDVDVFSLSVSHGSHSLGINFNQFQQEEDLKIVKKHLSFNCC